MDRLIDPGFEQRDTALPRIGPGALRHRWRIGTLVAVIAVPVVTAVLVPLRHAIALESVLLLYLLAVVVVSVVGGIGPGVATALASVLLANFFFTTPYNTLRVNQRDSIIALVVFILVAATVSVTVDLAIRSRVAATRSSTEAELLSRFAAVPMRQVAVSTVLDQVRRLFGFTSVMLMINEGTTERVAANVGPHSEGPPSVAIDTQHGVRLVAHGEPLFAEDRRLLGRLATAAAQAWASQELATEAAQAQQLAEVDRLRTALLAAVGHDLRTPLAGIKAAVTSLRQDDVTWSAEDSAELLATIDESADALDSLIANLLGMSRLQAGALSAVPVPVALDAVVSQALISLHTGSVSLDVPDDLPLVLVDPGLLERAIANVVANACQFSPPDRRTQIKAVADAEGHVALHVVDGGPGVPAEDWDAMFAPFTQLGTHTPDGGHGLGLAIAKGFAEASGGTLTPSDTPGGGLTMTFRLPVAP